MTSGWFIRRLTIGCWFAAVLTLCAESPPAATDGEAESPLRFRRLLVPEDLIPNRFSNYRPMKRETFEAEIQRINARASRASQTTARVTRASYRARLAGNDLLSGEAVLDVVRTESELAVLSLSPCGVAVGNLQWRDDAQTAIPVGTVASGEFLALVDRDGALQFSWSARGILSENGVRVFAISLPRCAATRLVLELPADVLPSTDSGAVISQAPVPPAATDAAPDVTAGPPAVRTWEMELGGHTEIALQLESRSPTADKRPPARLRESTRFRITAAGLELRANFQLAADQSRMEQLFLQVTPGLHIAAVHAGDRLLTVARPAGITNDELVQVVLDEPLLGSDQELVVLAFAPLIVGSPWDLPTVRPVGVAWQEGQAVVEVVEPLLLAGLRVQDGIETKIEPLAAPEQGESRQVQFWQPEGRAEVQLAYPPREIVADVGAAIRFNDLAAIGRLVVDVQARQGTTFSLQGLVSPGWTIDSVQSDPTEVLESFTTRGGRPRQELSIHLRHAIPIDQRWRIILRAHRRTPRLDQPLRGEVVRMVEFQDLKVNTSLVALSAEPPLRITLAGDEHLQRLDPQSLAVRQAEMVTPTPDAMIFFDQQVSRDWSVTLSREQPRFTAQLNLAAEVDATQFTESFELRCEPNQSHVSRLLVHLSRSDPTPLEWTLVDSGDNRLSTRLLDASADGIGGESWELSLSRPLNRPFVVRAVRRQPLEREAALSFVSLPEASSQTGTLRVHAAGCGPLEVRVRNLQPIAVNLPESSRLPTLRGAYRYAPSQEVAATIVRLPASETPSAAWLWLLHTNSRRDVQGDIEHETRLLVENTGLSSITVELPPAATLARVTVDHGIVAHPTVTAGQISIPLPKERRFPLVSVVYRTCEQPLGWGTAIRPVQLKCDLPCLQRRSSVWIPEGFALLGRSVAGTDDLPWDERLFGARLWRRGQRPFDALGQSDWSQLWNSLWPFAGTTPNSDKSGLVAATPASSEGLPWTGVAWSIGPEESACGWTTYDFTNGGSLPAELWVYRRGLAHAASGGLLLAVAGLAACLSRRHRRASWAGLILFAALALLVPADFVAVARAVFLGALLGVAWRRLAGVRSPRPPRVENSSQQFSVSRELVIASTATGVALFIWLLGASLAVAQDQRIPAPAAEASKTFNVLSPIDDKQQPKGDYLFVPQAMYDALYRRTNEPIGGVQGAWLESAEYHVSLAANEAEDPRLLPREFSMEWALRTFQSVTSVRIPWRRDLLRILDVTLDGQPSAVAWTEAGTELILVLENTGQHRVRIVARPLQSVPETAGEFATAISRCPRSRVVVHAATSLDRVTAPGALGPMLRDDVAGELSADLFPADELRVRWTAPTPKAQTAIDTDVTELLWLQAQASSLTVQGKFHFVARNGSLGQVAFLVDREWRLLPVGKDQPIAMVDVTAGDRQLVRCWLDRPYQDVTVQLSFGLTGSSGIGHWQLPQIAAQATRRAPTWLGITAAGGLSAELSSASTAARLVPSDFLEAWNEARDPPQQVFALTADTHSTQLAVRPLPERVAVQEQQDVLVGSERAAFRYEAVLTTEPGRVSQLRLLVPARFEPREIIALHDDANRLLRWSRVTDQELSIFLTSPLSGEIRLMVQGEVTLLRGNRERLPLLALANASPVQRGVNLFQEHDVRLELTSSPGLQPAPRNTSRTDWGRFVTSLAGGAPEVVRPALELLVHPNRPRVAGSIVTRLSLADDQWQMEAALHLEILEGAIDEVRIHVPAEVPGQIQRNPPGELTIQPAPGEGGRLLIARFPAPIDHELKLTLTGDLTMAVGDPIRVPELRVLDGISLKRYVVLPTRLQRQKATWDTSGLQSTELPAELANPSIPSDAAVYQVLGPRVQAVLREVERLAGTPQVHLADYQLRWSDDRQTRGIATFYLEPARLAEVELAMPDGTRPLHFNVAGLPALGRAIAGNRWRVPVGPELLPQLVEVLFEGSLPRDPSQGGEVVFAAPVITGIPVTQTLWTIQGPPNSVGGRPTLIHASADQKLLEDQRGQTAESLRRRGLADASQANPGDRDAWRADWDARIRQIDLRSALSGLPIPARSKLSPTVLPIDLAGQWLAESVHAGPQVHCVLRGAAPQLGLQYTHEAWRVIVARASSLTLLLAIVAGGTWLTRRSSVRELWTRYPQLLIAVAGLGWWLFFVPSILGLVLLIVGVVSALRPRWKTQSA